MKELIGKIAEVSKPIKIEILQSLPVNVGTAAGTISAGLATWFQWIPEDIGKLAALIGILFSITLTVYRIMLIRREYLEQKILKENHLKKMNDGVKIIR